MVHSIRLTQTSCHSKSVLSRHIRMLVLRQVPVSYTHLDVYKRQYVHFPTKSVTCWACPPRSWMPLSITSVMLSFSRVYCPMKWHSMTCLKKEKTWTCWKSCRKTTSSSKIQIPISSLPRWARKLSTIDVYKRQPVCSRRDCKGELRSVQWIQWNQIGRASCRERV